MDVRRSVLKYYAEYFCHWYIFIFDIFPQKFHTKKFGNLWKIHRRCIVAVIQKTKHLHICMVILLPWPTDIAHFQKIFNNCFQSKRFFFFSLRCPWCFRNSQNICGHRKHCSCLAIALKAFGQVFHVNRTWQLGQ